MAQQPSPRALGPPGEEDVAPDSQTQLQPVRPRPVRSRRRRRRQAAPASREEDEPRTFQVYKFSSRAPPVSGHGSGGSSRTPALPDDGNVMGMMARSARYWVKREPPQCWVRGCTCACSETDLEEGHPSRSRPHHLGEDNSSTSMIRGELFSEDEDNDGNTGTASSWAGVRSDDHPRSFAEEYSLVPLSRRKQYSAQTFHEAVERFLRGF
ncbi:uncharacterized protein LOC111925023 [Cyanistes caeruleus]|uniref:uncharacterized protein LOC111925023 n=1 Tax=Cyanistes caeruleus TaxID=156563 RepID=UPI000CDA6292|nr:uncharacterized protein LOC111925023 [Cyanistes caeruleus]